MAFTTKEKWGAGLVAGLGVAAYAFKGKTANAATAPYDNGVRLISAVPITLPATTPVQSRPIASGSPSILVAQQQLNALGYGPLATDGIYGPASLDAMTNFLGAHPMNAAQTAAYASAPGVTQDFYTLDDYVRAASGQPAGANPSSGLFSPARHRGLR